MAAFSGSNAQNNPAVARQGSNHAERFNIWLADLESIRRQRPVVSPFTNMANKVVIQPPPGPVPEQPGPPVYIDDDDDDRRSPTTLLRAFYGIRAGEDERIRYQDHKLARQNKYPSPRNGLGFNMDQLRRDRKWVSPIKELQDVQPTWDHGMFMKNPPLGFDEAVSKNWAQDSSPTSLLFGFPMLGDVVFYRPANYRGARSACFFKAVAYLVYGDQSHYQRVQAEHLQHYSDILEWEDHPRHQLYTDMNKVFSSTRISPEGTSPGIIKDDVTAVTNLFQRLSIPNTWMTLDVLDITADLYNLFIVVYTIDERSRVQPLVTEVNVKGSYNARHVFMLFNGDHFQPMVPNDFLASEFTFPRVTYENVKGLPWSRDTDQGKSSVDLRWRMTWGQRLDRRNGALPVDHVFYRESLRTVMTGNYSQQ